MDEERVTTHWEILALWFQEAETKTRFKYKWIIKKLLSEPKPETWENVAEPYIALDELLFPLTNIN